MIKINCRDRLGNTLFQYAVGRNLSIRRNTTLKLNLCGSEDKNNCLKNSLLRQLSQFNLKAELSVIRPAATKSIGSEKILPPTTIFEEKEWGFIPEVLELDGNITLEGYFQSEKYFIEIEDVIREDLTLSVNSDEPLFNRYRDEILRTNSVSIHVRRGDYLELDSHNICTLNYYSKSIEFLQSQFSDLQFFVFSDDINWCSENFRFKSRTFVNMNKAENNPLLDFKLMSSCKHNIITNSSYSWWAAWLNDNVEKLVVSPDRWFSKEAALRWKVGSEPLLEDWKTIKP